MRHFLLFYDVADDFMERRPDFRREHLEVAWQAHERGELVLAGALLDPPDGALLLFRGEAPAVAEQFAHQDPYVVHGLVRSWRVREWTTVVGTEPANPVRL